MLHNNTKINITPNPNCNLNPNYVLIKKGYDVVHFSVRPLSWNLWFYGWLSILSSYLIVHKQKYSEMLTIKGKCAMA